MQHWHKLSSVHWISVIFTCDNVISVDWKNDLERTQFCFFHIEVEKTMKISHQSKFKWINGKDVTTIAMNYSVTP